MELFDKKYLYLEWDDCLKGKKVVVGDLPQLIRRCVNENVAKVRWVENNSSDSEMYPFVDEDGTEWVLVYYDPNYECKVAWKQGKQIQFRNTGAHWIDTSSPSWKDNVEYRVKPEKTWRPFKDIQELKQAWENKRSPLVHPELEEPMIWVRSKSNTTSTYLITHYCENMGVVYLCGYLNVSLEQLFEDYTFLDGGVMGVAYEE